MILFMKYPIYAVVYTLKQERPTPVTLEKDMPLKHAIALAVVAGESTSEKGLSSLLQGHLKNSRGLSELCRNASVRVITFRDTGFKSDKIGVISTEYPEQWLENPMREPHYFP